MTKVKILISVISAEVFQKLLLLYLKPGYKGFRRSFHTVIEDHVEAPKIRIIVALHFLQQAPQQSISLQDW